MEESIAAIDAVVGSVATAAERAWLARGDEPLAFVRLWARKECAVKLGWTDLDGMTRIDFTDRHGLRERVAGAVVLDRSTPERALVAMSAADLRWTSHERLLAAAQDGYAAEPGAELRRPGPHQVDDRPDGD